VSGIGEQCDRVREKPADDLDDKERRCKRQRDSQAPNWSVCGVRMAYPVVVRTITVVVLVVVPVHDGYL
jgi:hypothetical protein